MANSFQYPFALFEQFNVVKQREMLLLNGKQHHYPEFCCRLVQKRVLVIN